MDRALRFFPRLSAFFATALLVLALPGCSGRTIEEGGFSIELETVPNPPSIGQTLLRLRLREPSGAHLTGARVRVEGNMNHAGMVPEFADAEETAPGMYEGLLELTMGGDWFLVVTARVDDGRVLEEIIELPRVNVTREEG